MSERVHELPQKLFYRIQEVSRITGVKPYVLRYWETEFASLRPEKGPNDQRRYRPQDIELIHKIKKLLYEEKFTIAGARQHLETGGGNGGGGRAASARHVGPSRRSGLAARLNVGDLARRLNHVRRELIELQSFLAG